MVLEEISFEELQDGHGGHLGYRNGTILAILNLSQSHCDVSHQVLTQSDLWFGRRCRLKNFKMAIMYGGHLGYQNVKLLAILYLCDASHQVSAQSDRV